MFLLFEKMNKIKTLKEAINHQVNMIFNSLIYNNQYNLDHPECFGVNLHQMSLSDIKKILQKEEPRLNIQDIKKKYSNDSPYGELIIVANLKGDRYEFRKYL